MHFLATVALLAAVTLSDDDKQFLKMVNAPLVLKVPGAENVRVIRDVVYEQTSSGPLRADVYLPAKSTSKRAIAIFIHGGMGPEFPVRPKEWGMYQSWGRTMAASGLVSVVFNHRLGYPETSILKGSADLDAILAYVTAHAAEWNADSSRIALLAYSAGGPLLSHALRDHPPSIRCLVSFYNFLDISRTLEHPKSETPETIREFSPSNAVNAQSPPILVVRAGKDQIPKLNESIATFVARAIEVNAPLTFMVHPDADHGFENKADDARTREILEATVAFVKRYTAR
jgi:acetyl esterase/lipase